MNNQELKERIEWIIAHTAAPNEHILDLIKQEKIQMIEEIELIKEKENTALIQDKYWDGKQKGIQIVIDYFKNQL